MIHLLDPITPAAERSAKPPREFDTRQDEPRNRLAILEACLSDRL
jgi:hypothetical protein